MAIRIPHGEEWNIYPSTPLTRGTRLYHYNDIDDLLGTGFTLRTWCTRLKIVFTDFDQLIKEPTPKDDPR